MSNHKATPDCWEWQEKWASQGEPDEISSCILELRARVEALEAQADHSPGATKLVPPPVATDEELLKIWNSERACNPWAGSARRAIYDLGVAHGQASSREVADPEPVAGGLVGRVSDAITSETGLEVARWLREQGWKETADLLEQEAGR
jgi:hypothetical protein